MLLWSVFVQAQSGEVFLKCYNNETFKEADCNQCGIKSNTFSGIIVKYKGLDYAFYNPVKVTSKGNLVTFEDAYNSKPVTVPITSIITHNTVNKLIAFITACKCGDCISGGGGGGDKFVASGSKSGNDLILTFNDASTITISNIYNKETIWINGTGAPTNPTNDSGNRVFAVGDKYLDTQIGQIYRYNGSSWLLIFDPFSEYEEFTLNGAGEITLSAISAYALASIIPTQPARYVVEIEGQVQNINRSDFTIGGPTLTFSGGAANSGQRGSIRILK